MHVRRHPTIPAVVSAAKHRQPQRSSTGLYVWGRCANAVVCESPAVAIHRPLPGPAFWELIANSSTRDYNVLFRKGALLNRWHVSCRRHPAIRHILPNLTFRVEISFVEPAGLQILTVLCHPFEQNTYVAWLDGRSDCVVIDPGLEPAKILDALEKRRLGLAAILDTHGHSDHIGGNAALKERWPDCPLVIGAGDAAKLTDPWANLSAAFGVPLLSPAADVLVNDGNVYQAAGMDWLVRSIPGHTSGHVVFLCGPRHVFVGDVIFAGSIGRTDFPDGDHHQLLAGIRSKLFSLPDDTVLLPGHGPATTVGEEKRTNPFVGLSAR